MEHILGGRDVPPAVTVPRALVVLLLVTLLTAGCTSLLPGQAGQEGNGVVVTSQPLYDAFDRLGHAEQVSGLPDWAIVTDPTDARRLGRPFTLPTEEVLAISPRTVLDQPHPLVSGPDRKAFRSGLQQAGIPVEVVDSPPTLAAMANVLWAAANATEPESDPGPILDGIRANLTALEDGLAGLDQPTALVLFPAGLSAGTGTDVDTILGLAGLANLAAEAGLEGYQQISTEAIRQGDPDLVIATATMRQDPSTLAKRPMFRGTSIEDRPDRVLVVDPGRTTRVGPYVDQAAWMLATWAHEEIGGPRVNAWFSPSEAEACREVTLHVLGDQTVTADLAGHALGLGDNSLPDLPAGHYRVPVTRTDSTPPATIDLILTVEGDACDT